MSDSKPLPFAEPVSPSPQISMNATVHLDFLDGIRGLSAFYVILHHAYLMLVMAGVGDQGGTAGHLMSALRPLAFGRYAVDMFIVLSGYCLMLPIVRGSKGLKGGFKGYIRRRARRILPPYFAALVFSLCVIAGIHFWGSPISYPNEIVARFPGAGDLLSHLFLVHNLVNKWSHSINAPMWSVATEWQIYFLFPLLLLPLWKRWGMAAAVVAGFLLGLGADWLMPGGLGGASPWFIGLFALGMAGAVINFSIQPEAALLREKIPWGLLSLILMVGLVAVGSLVRGWFKNHATLIDPLFGLSAMCLIIRCAQANTFVGLPSRPWFLKVLNSRWVVASGAFSYSLYLTHRPLLDVATLLLFHAPLSPLLRIVMTFGIYAPVGVGFAYLFHLAFERPFMPGRPRTLPEAAFAAEISPAP